MTKGKPLTEKEMFALFDEKPEIERELQYAQYYFLKDRSDENFQKLYSLIYNYSFLLVKRRLKKKTFLPPEIIREKAADAAINFIRQYKTIEDFKVEDSFTGMMDFKIKEILYDKSVIFNDKVIQDRTVKYGDKDEVSFLENPNLWKLSEIPTGVETSRKCCESHEDKIISDLTDIESTVLKIKSLIDTEDFKIPITMEILNKLRTGEE